MQPYQYYSDVFDMFQHHCNFLNDLLIMKNNARQNTAKKNQNIINSSTLIILIILSILIISQFFNYCISYCNINLKISKE